MLQENQPEKVEKRLFRKRHMRIANLLLQVIALLILFHQNSIPYQYIATTKCYSAVNKIEDITTELLNNIFLHHQETAQVAFISNSKLQYNNKTSGILLLQRSQNSNEGYHYTMNVCLFQRELQYEVSILVKRFSLVDYNLPSSGKLQQLVIEKD